MSSGEGAEMPEKEAGGRLRATPGVLSGQRWGKELGGRRSLTYP